MRFIQSLVAGRRIRALEGRISDLQNSNERLQCEKLDLQRGLSDLQKELRRQNEFFDTVRQAILKLQGFYA